MSKFKVGDRVKVVCPYFKNGEAGTVSMVKTYTVRIVIDGYPYSEPHCYHGFGFHELELIEKDKPMSYKTWGEMTREEKGELLLAHHEGKVIQYLSHGGDWIDEEYSEFDVPSGFYRVKPEPVVETVVVYGRNDGGPASQDWSIGSANVPWTLDTHKITFDVVDGKVDCNSVKMEAL